VVTATIDFIDCPMAGGLRVPGILLPRSSSTG
jgi:hypothetical protein